MLTGSQLKSIRRKLGYAKQTDLARTLKVAVVTISNWERRRDSPLPQKVERKLRKFFYEEWQIKVRGTDPNDIEAQGILGLLGSLVGATAGAIVGGPLGAVIAAGAGAGIGAAIGSDVSSGERSLWLVTECPWCYRVVRVSSVDDKSDYECRHCELEFRFRRGRGVKRLG